MNTDTLTHALAGMADLTTLSALLAVVGLDRTLGKPGSYTLFAPTNEAFAQLTPEVLTALPINQIRLHAILSDHIIPEALVAADLMDLEMVTTLSGTRLGLTSTHGLQVEQSYLIEADHITGNGVLHRIDAVLLLR